MPEGWLRRRTSVQAVEMGHFAHSSSQGDDPVSFGHVNNEWKRLLDCMQPGDELWEFSSPPKTWEMLCGRAGIVLLRQGEVIATILTYMN